MKQSSLVHSNSLMNVTLAQVAAMLPGSECIGDASASINRLQMDSRQVESGDLFLALKGERFDAHDFLKDLSTVAGVSAVVQKNAKSQVIKLGMNAVCVEDTKLALGALAKAWRGLHPIPLIAVTGSNGKTTVTQMIACILSAHAGDRALATQGNLNNDIGLPQTLLRLRSAHTCGVVELGMNHPGEIEYLANIAQPSVGLINNAQREHQEFMSTVEAVAIENGQVIEALPGNGIAVFPFDDEFTPLWVKMCGKKSYMTFSDEVLAHKKLSDSSRELGNADVRLTNCAFNGGKWTLKVQTPQGVLDTELFIAGEHNVKNALAAIASCLAIQIPLEKISEGLSQFRAVKGRSRPLTLNFKTGSLNPSGNVPSNGTSSIAVDVIDDTYNANPDSVIAAINVLSQMASPSLLILGDMGEVGSEGPSYHKEVGEYAAKRGVSAFYGLGELTEHAVNAFNKQAHADHKLGIHFQSMEDLIRSLPQVPAHFKSVLVKGSRFMKMEQSVQALETLQSSLQVTELENIKAQLAAQQKESTCC